MKVQKMMVTLYLREDELRNLEVFRRSTEEHLEELGCLKDQEYNLSDAVQYIIGETLSGRYIKIDSHAFSE